MQNEPRKNGYESKQHRRAKESVLDWTPSQKSLSAKVKDWSINMRKGQIAIMAAALLIAAQARASLDLVNNGSFDNTLNTFKVNHSDSGAMALGTSSTINSGKVLPGWMVSAPAGGNISWDSGANPYHLSASTGNQSQYFLDLTGWTDGSGGQYGGVSQVVQHTVAGQTYRLTFDIGSSTTYDGSTAPGIRVSINGGVLATDYATINGINNWTSETLTFTATGTTTRLLLSGVSAGGPIEYIGLDNVRLSAVPEPTTLIAGIGALGMLLFGAGVHSKRAVIRIGK